MTDLIACNEVLYCVCRSSNIDTFMISCDKCQEWFHGDCVGVNETNAKAIDLYFCPGCVTANPSLRITYKMNNQSKKKNSKKSRHIQNRNNRETSDTGGEMVDFVRNSPGKPDQTSIDEELARIFESDTSSRKAKTAAKESLKIQNEITESDKGKRKKMPPLRQCYGPECVKLARINSKYCSDDCGLKLGTNRILEILPQRLQQGKMASAADENSMMKLTAVRREQKIIRNSLEQLDIKITQLIQLVHKSKNSREDAILDDYLDEECSSFDCKICGAETPLRTAVKHLELCYKKQERRILLTGTTTRPDDIEWNIFCNHKIARQGYCKKLRVLCPVHCKDSKNEDELCGYPVVMNLSDCTGKFCGRLKKQCTKHPNCWEDNFRAELDMEKLQLLGKLGELDKEELSLRRDMACRGNLLALMLHQTIVH